MALASNFRPIFKLNGKRISYPINWQELTLELNYDKDDPDFRGEVSTNSWEFGLGDGSNDEDGADISNTYISDGLIGGDGVFVGSKFEIFLTDGSTTELIFDGMIDFSGAEISCDKVTANSLEVGKIDWLNEVADSFTFEYLFEKEGTITKNDFVTIPYFLADVPDTQKAVILVLCFYAVAQDIFILVSDIQATLAECIASSAWGWEAIFALIVYIARLAILLITVAKLLKDFYASVIGFVKYTEGMFLLTLLKKGAAYLDMSFSSPFIDNTQWKNVVIIPEKYNHELNDNEVSTETAVKTVLGINNTNSSPNKNKGYYRGTYGDLLRECKKIFNAKIVIEDDVIRLVPLDYDSGTTKFQLPKVYRYQNLPYKLNSDDLKSLYSISFQPDLNDKTVWQNYLGTELQVVTTPGKTYTGNDLRRVLTKGEEKVQLNFARGKRKDKLTYPERMFAKFLVVLNVVLFPILLIINIRILILNFFIKILVNPILFALNNLGISTTRSLPYIEKITVNDLFGFYIEERLDILLMENDFINIPKMVLVQKSGGIYKISKSNQSLINAEFLWENYHYKNSFIEDTDIPNATHNQYKIYSLTDIPFCKDDYDLVRASNIIKLPDGITEGELVSLKWNIYDQKADITYKVKDKYTENLNILKVYSDGR